MVSNVESVKLNCSLWNSVFMLNILQTAVWPQSCPSWFLNFFCRLFSKEGFFFLIQSSAMSSALIWNAMPWWQSSWKDVCKRSTVWSKADHLVFVWLLLVKSEHRSTAPIGTNVDLTASAIKYNVNWTWFNRSLDEMSTESYVICFFAVLSHLWLHLRDHLSTARRPSCSQKVPPLIWHEVLWTKCPTVKIREWQIAK